MVRQKRHILSAHGQPLLKGFALPERNTFTGSLGQQVQSLLPKSVQQWHFVTDCLGESCAQNINRTVVGYVFFTCSHAIDFIVNSHLRSRTAVPSISVIYRRRCQQIELYYVAA